MSTNIAKLAGGGAHDGMVLVAETSHDVIGYVVITDDGQGGIDATLAVKRGADVPMASIAEALINLAADASAVTR